jgi:hypothetical protein
MRASIDLKVFMDVRRRTVHSVALEASWLEVDHVAGFRQWSQGGSDLDA